MSDDVLERLLEVEKEAARIVEDAQQKASIMAAESDRTERIAYNEKYKEAVSRLNKERNAALQQLESDYNEEMALYQKELDAQSVNYEAFNKMLTQALFGDGA